MHACLEAMELNFTETCVAFNILCIGKLFLNSFKEIKIYKNNNIN